MFFIYLFNQSQIQFITIQKYHHIFTMSSSSNSSPSDKQSSNKSSKKYHKSGNRDQKYYDPKRFQNFKSNKKLTKYKSKQPSLNSSSDKKKKSIQHIKDKKDSREQKSINKKKNQIPLPKVRNDKQSDFRSHLVFVNIPIQKEYQQQFINLLKQVLSKNIGKVQIIQKLDTVNQKNKLSISLAFKYDRHAVEYLDQKYGLLQIKFKDTFITLKPSPSNAFKYYAPQARRIRKQQVLQQQKNKQIQNRKKQKEKEKQKQQRDKYMKIKIRRKNDRHKKSRSRDREKKKFRSSSQSQRSLKKNTRENLIILKLFGIPKHLRQKDILPALKKHPQGPFKLETWCWSTIQKAEYFQISLPQKAAKTLINMKNEFELEEIPPLIIKCAKDNESIRNALSQHQVKVEFTKSMHPLNVYNTFKQFGRIVQFTGQNNQNKIYYITFLQSKVAKTVKNLKLELDNEVDISYLKEGQLVYRPSRKTTLKYLMKNGSQSSKKQNEKSNEQRRKDHRRE